MRPRLKTPTARQLELTIRVIALALVTCAAPGIVIWALAAGHPLMAIGSAIVAGPMAAVRAIPPPDTG
jgi:hypothetical protein